MTRPPSDGDRAALARWYARPLGRALLEAERAALDDALAGLSGYHAVQVGSLGEADLLAASPSPHRVVLEGDASLDRGRVGLFAAPESLPLVSDSVGSLLLPHTLEFCADPHEVLREAYRVLIPEGHLVLLGFNPWGPWGARRLLGGCEAPWSGRFLPAARVSDWLALLGFKLVARRALFHRPPLESEALLRRLGWLEGMGARWWPALSAAYLLVARKRVVPLTPVRPRWRARRGLVPGGLAEPTTRARRTKS